MIYVLVYMFYNKKLVTNEIEFVNVKIYLLLIKTFFLSIIHLYLINESRIKIKSMR
jgi:hypothetical protein